MSSRDVSEIVFNEHVRGSLEAFELATLEWVDWLNHRRLLGPIGKIPPVEFEEAYYRLHKTRAIAAGVNRLGLRRTRGDS